MDITIHWHGILQIGSPEMDGVPGVTQWAIPPLGDYTYKFTPTNQTGLHWYHAHLRGYLDDGVKGLLYIRPSAQRPRPFQLIDPSGDQVAAMQQAEDSPRNLALYDWKHVQEDEALAMFFASGRPTTCVDSVLFNGKGSIYCASAETLNQAAGGRFDAMPFFESKLDARGCLVIPGSGIYSAHTITSPMGCSNSTGQLEIVPTHSEWTLINLANVGGEWTWVFSIDAHDLWVISADGDYIVPEKVQALPVSIGQRYGVMVRTDKPDGGDYYIRANSAGFAQVMGGVGILRYQDAPHQKRRTTEQTSVSVADPWRDMSRSHVKYNATPAEGTSTYDPIKSMPFIADAPPSKVDRTLIFHANQSEPTVFSIASRPLRMVEELNLPVLFSNSSQYTGTRDPDWLIRIAKGDVVDVILQNAQNALFPAPAEPPHPIHLHGHKFWVLGSNEYDDWQFQSAAEAMAHGVQLNLDNPPKRDTFLLPTAGWLVLRFVADNPGAWMLHCHSESIDASMRFAFLDPDMR